MFGAVNSRPRKTATEVTAMSEKRRVEVFTAGCPVCEGVVNMVKPFFQG